MIPGATIFQRGEKLVHDARVQLVEYLRIYGVVPDAGRRRIDVVDTVLPNPHPQAGGSWLIRGGELERVAGPFRVACTYETDLAFVPKIICVVCKHCEWRGPRRRWVKRQFLLKDANSHRCPLLEHANPEIT